MYLRLILSTFVVSALGRPQNPENTSQQLSNTQQQYSIQPSANATIINKTEQVNEDGSFSYSFETSDGIRVQQNGFLKKSDNIPASSADNQEAQNESIQVLTGGYSYVAPNGETIQIQYTADENGYQPQGSHIPTVPPSQPNVINSLEQINNSPQQYDQGNVVTRDVSSEEEIEGSSEEQ
ncbi:endocuticle structural glycoprotein SgAbd-3-like [Coccinella septempunctata]|uniref:endocuticle structural glycoprotein SgAbd-3-like n=1 Tax=Coccinella septempunctata TaxID=41139 RepID=UPI001D093FE3|nr:endocuticle structural glycoprotein SgAbd-3-like [Coccinella septempunctata]